MRFDLRARRAGTGKLTFTVTGPDGIGDLLVHELPVQALALMEAASVSGETEGAELCREVKAEIGARHARWIAQHPESFAGAAA